MSVTSVYKALEMPLSTTFSAKDANGLAFSGNPEANKEAC
jgi:hypothetical protein